MKAAVRREYGLPDVVRLEEVPKPVPRRGEVLIRVRAASLNASDWEFLTGKPLYIRMWGLQRPNTRTRLRHRGPGRSGGEGVTALLRR